MFDKKTVNRSLFLPLDRRGHFAEIAVAIAHQLAIHQFQLGQLDGSTMVGSRIVRYFTTIHLIGTARMRKIEDKGPLSDHHHIAMASLIEIIRSQTGLIQDGGVVLPMRCIV